jgi:hypothetical protein
MRSVTACDPQMREPNVGLFRSRTGFVSAIAAMAEQSVLRALHRVHDCVSAPNVTFHDRNALPRTDPNEQESVVLLPELDRLALASAIA